MIVQDYLDDLTMLVDNSDSTPYNPMYIGFATPGSDITKATWKIQNLLYDEHDKLISKKWAGSSTKFDKVWQDRAGYTYG